MKKIFTIEINEKDSKFEDVEIVKRLDNMLSTFAKEINSERNVYIKFKRIGNTWDAIVNKVLKEENAKTKIKYSNNKKHLKIIK